MKQGKLAALLLAGTVGMAACADQPIPTGAVAPEGPAFSSESVEMAESETGRYLVDVSGQMKKFQDRVEALGGTVVFAHAATRIAVVEGFGRDGALGLVSDGVAKSVAPDVLIPLELPNSIGTAEAAEISSPENPSAATFFPRQWHLRAIGADQAWAAGRTGSSSVRVAILDTGISPTHPDVASLIDHERSASFVPFDDPYINFYFPGMPRWTDLHYHGTHVAATVSSNAFAAAGVTSHVTLMAVKVCNVNGSCPASSVIPGVLHAADNDADVINMSLGGAMLRAGSEGYVGFLNRTFNYASRAGVTVVVAAGNNASDLDRNIWQTTSGPIHYPSLFATYCDVAATLCVAATGPTSGGIPGPWLNVDNPAAYTNFGRSAINVAAPGGAAGGLVTAACTQQSLRIPVCQTGVYVVGLGGTSMASPHVAGLAALLVEDYGRNPGRIRSAIQNSADDVGAPGVDPFSGKGRINVVRALGL
jgi:lantibiotic leader peptide-processing serine protease